MLASYALVQVAVPVDRFPEFVGYIIRRLKVLCPIMGKENSERLLYGQLNDEGRDWPLLLNPYVPLPQPFTPRTR